MSLQLFVFLVLLNWFFLSCWLVLSYSVFVCYFSWLFSRKTEIVKKKGMDLGGEGSGRSWGMWNHDQNILYEKNLSSIKKTKYVLAYNKLIFLSLKLLISPITISQENFILSATKTKTEVIFVTVMALRTLFPITSVWFTLPWSMELINRDGQNNECLKPFLFKNIF